MKKFMITGGLTGFLIGFISGWTQQIDWPGLLVRASFGSLVAGFLMRWWGWLWARSLQELAQRRASSTAEQANPSPVSLAAKP